MVLIVAGPLAAVGQTTDRAPRLVAAWPAGPLELRLAFDSPVAVDAEKKLIGRAIEFTTGKGESAPHSRLRIAAARRADGGRTLILATDPHPRQADYRLDLAGVSDARFIYYDLSGVEVSLGPEGAEGQPTWSGWWPVADPVEVKRRLAGSAEHERALALLGKPGQLTLRTQLKLPAGKSVLRIESNGSFEANLGGEEARSMPAGNPQRAELELATSGEAVELWLTAATGTDGKPLILRLARRSGDAFQPIAADRWLLPWVPPTQPLPAEAPALPFDVKKGDPKRGEEVFFSDEAKCSTCHKVAGRGGDVGPALDDLARHDLAAVYREIAEPSALINPEYVPYTVALKSGQVAVGVVRAEGADSIRVLGTDGKATVLPRSDVEELRPSGTSIMPVGLVGVLGESRMRDLLAFLMTRHPESSKE